MIKIILFDLGEVVLTNDWHYDCPEKFDEYSSYFGITRDQMEKGWNNAWPDYELGKISEDKFWKKFLITAGSNKVDCDKAKELWRKYFKAKDLFEILSKLKQKYTLVVASSTGKEWLEYKQKTFQLDNYFSKYITTCNTGVKKTTEKFFQIVLTKLNAKGDEVIMVDDSQKVLEAAQKLGIKTILFLNSEQLQEELTKQGIAL